MKHKIKSWALCLLVVGWIQSEAVAAERSITWSGAFSPDNITRTFVKYGISALRSLVDLTYKGVSIDLSRGTMEFADVQISPLLDWDEELNCKIKIPRISIDGPPFGYSDTYHSTLSIFDLSAPLSCLPFESRLAYMALGQNEINLSALVFGFDYNFPSSSMEITLAAEIPGLGGINGNLDLSYVSFDSGLLSNLDPTPVIYLRSGYLNIENGGGWESIKELLPAKYVKLADAPEIIANDLSAILFQLVNDPASYSQEIAYLNKSLKYAWKGFLHNPDRLVIKTTFNPKNPIFMDFGQIQIEELIPKLQLRFSNDLGDPNQKISTDSLEAIISGQTEIPNSKKLEIGIALLTGNGVPENRSLAIKVLKDLPESAMVNYAGKLAHSMVNADPNQAYKWAITAGSLGDGSVMNLMYELEEKIGLEEVLDIQPTLNRSEIEVIFAGNVTALQIKHKARKSFLGLGNPKSYLNALYWASICAAAADKECGGIEKKVRKRLESEANWSVTATLKKVSDTALADWISFRLAEKL